MIFADQSRGGSDERFNYAIEDLLFGSEGNSIMPSFELSADGPEVLWLASYPRSGNTFLRLILNQAFGVPTASVYKAETRSWEVAPGLVDMIGHYEPVSSNQSRNGLPRIVKTHDAPSDDGPAIYIVRDGRSSIVSYFHYLRDIVHLPIALEDVVVGKQWPGTWSGHYKLWAPARRPNTLLLRYEDLKSSTNDVCQQISDFLQRPQIKDFKLSFADLHELYPKFFRGGDDARNIAEMGPLHELFDALHGDLMRELKYY